MSDLARLLVCKVGFARFHSLADSGQRLYGISGVHPRRINSVTEPGSPGQTGIKRQIPFTAIEDFVHRGYFARVRGCKFRQRTVVCGVKGGSGLLEPRYSIPDFRKIRFSLLIGQLLDFVEVSS